jgi:hypothetical protein
MRPRLLVAAVAGTMAWGVALAPPAVAQDGEATITVDQLHPSTSSVHYIVDVTDAAGEPVEGATVTATATASDGTTGEPTTLSAAGGGQYQGTVELGESGTWTVVFESADPPAELSHTQEMPAEVQGGEEDGGGGNTVVLVLAAIFLAVVAAIAGWIWLTRQREPVEDPVGPPVDQP